MGAANAAVVGQEDGGAVGGQGDAAEEVLAVGSHAGANDGNDADAAGGGLLGEFPEALLLFAVGRGVEDEEEEAGGVGAPVEGVQGGGQGVGDGLGLVAAAVGALGADEVENGGVGGEVLVAGEVFLAVVAVVDGAEAEVGGGQFAAGAVHYVGEFGGQEAELVAHATGGVDDEGDVGGGDAGAGAGEAQGGDAVGEGTGGLAGGFLGGGCGGADEEGSLVLAGFGPGAVPEFGAALVVGAGGPLDLAVGGFEVDFAVGYRLAGGVGQLDGVAVVGEDGPGGAVGVELGAADVGPELPLAEVVDFGGGELTGGGAVGGGGGGGNVEGHFFGGGRRGWWGSVLGYAAGGNGSY